MKISCVLGLVVGAFAPLVSASNAPVAATYAMDLAATKASPALGFTPAQDPKAAQDPESLCRAMCDAQDRGMLSVAAAIAYLADENESVADTAAAIVRHQWAALSDEFFRGLDASPRAAYRFLEELARAPRPAAALWVAGQIADKPSRSLGHRLLALAARGSDLDQGESQLLVQALRTGMVGDGYHYAVGRLPQKLAGRLLGRLHQGLMQGDIRLGDAIPILDRLSARGIQSLLGLAIALPQETAYQLLRHVHEARPKLLQDRVIAMLDGRAPIESALLSFAGKLLTTKERIQRVVAALADGKTVAVRERAFELLLSEGVLDEASLKVAVSGGNETRIRSVIKRSVNTLPESDVVKWLQSSPEVVLEMTRALLTRRVLEPAIQTQLLDLLDGLGAAESHTPWYAVLALVQGGDAAALKTIWPLVIDNRSWSDLLHRFGRRREAFVTAIMLAELQVAVEQPLLSDESAEQLRQSKVDTLRLLLVARGEHLGLDALIANAPDRGGVFLRRCRQYAVKLSPAQADALFDAAIVADDPEVATGLLEWIVSVQPSSIGERLWQLWTSPPDVSTVEDLLETAMRLLVSSDKREAMLAQLRTAFDAGPLPSILGSLPYEAINSVAEPMHISDVMLCAELLLKMPLADGEGERRRSARWPEGTSGYPLVAALGQRLRSADVADADQVFATMVEEVRADPRCSNISHQRLKVFWRSLSSRPDLQRLLGRITSRLWTAGGDGDRLITGCAVWFRALDAEHQGEWQKAEALYRRAIGLLLRLPDMRGEARWLLGDRDPLGGDDPFAALAASPYRVRLLAARQSGDVSAITKASLLVREFAGHDCETLVTLNANPPESGR